MPIREFYYLPDPLVGFHDPAILAAGAPLRSALGLTGFLEYFRFTLDYATHPPEVELDTAPRFNGTSGPLPRDRGLHDFIVSLRASP